MKPLPEANVNERESRVFAAWREERLSPDAKRAMRLALTNVVQKTARPKALSVSQFFGRTVFSYRRSVAGAFSLILLVSAGVGVVSASEQALPGGVLYPVKTKVSEPVRGWFYRTPEERTQWKRVLIERRLEEADTLASSDTLGEVESQQISELITKHRDSLEADGVDENEVEQFLETRGRKTRVEVNEDRGERRYRVVRREEEQREELSEHESEEESENEADEDEAELRESEQGNVSEQDREEGEERKGETQSRAVREKARSEKESKKSARSKQSDTSAGDSKSRESDNSGSQSDDEEDSDSEDHEDDGDDQDDNDRDDDDSDDSDSSGKGS